MVFSNATDCQIQILRSASCLGGHWPPVPLLPELLNGPHLTFCPAAEQLGRAFFFFLFLLVTHQPSSMAVSYISRPGLGRVHSAWLSAPLSAEPAGAGVGSAVAAIQPFGEEA